ncbi:hypothetical protein [Variovorax rhizosphaerae]|uniref:Uncharacterized protein n=1 Tax=Variovorax rhizosphaerae TaxID=1836200 RepID=A0ABU8WVJ8_9BURK
MHVLDALANPVATLEHGNATAPFTASPMSTVSAIQASMIKRMVCLQRVDDRQSSENGPLVSNSKQRRTTGTAARVM